jgi:hypothetical protein
MDDRVTELPATAHPKVTAVHAYWRKIAPGGGALPGRKHLDPVDIPSLLENIWLIDVLPGDPERFRVRLIGEKLRRLGNPVKPGDFLDLHLEETAGSMADMRFVVKERKPVWFRGQAELHHTTTMFELERLFLPLAADGMTVDMVLGVAIFYTLQGKLI